MKSADFDPPIVWITVVFGDPYRHRQAGHARRQLHFRPILRDGFRSGRPSKIVRHIRVSAAPDRFDLLGMAEGVKKGFCRFHVGRLEPFAEPAIGRIQRRQRIDRTAQAAQEPRQASRRHAIPRTLDPAGAPSRDRAAMATPRDTSEKTLCDASSRATKAFYRRCRSTI
jgi:hypothetical protein